MGINSLEYQIIQWGTDKGILPDPDPWKQFVKTAEEVSELADGIANREVDEVRDAIGDIVVTLVMQCRAWDLTLEECVQAAYDEIKNRKGKMVDGLFVKEN